MRVFANRGTALLCADEQTTFATQADDCMSANAVDPYWRNIHRIHAVAVDKISRDKQARVRTCLHMLIGNTDEIQSRALDCQPSFPRSKSLRFREDCTILSYDAPLSDDVPGV